MNLFELFGLILASPFIFTEILANSRILLGFYYLILRNNIHDYGYVRGLALETVFSQARDVVQRIRRHVLGRQEAGAKQAWLIKQSYKTSFNMIAVAVRY